MEVMKSNKITSRLQNTVARASVALGIVCASLLVAPSAIAANGGGPAIAPPESHPYGQTMAEWLSDYFRWKFGPNPADDMSGNVLFLSALVPGAPSGSGTLEDPLVLTGYGDVTIKAGTAMLDVLIAWWGELYPDGSVDPTLPGNWWGTYVTGEVIVDGKTVLDNVADYYVSPQTFDPPLLYPEPTPWDAIGTAFVQGVPIMLRPLSVGVHTLVENAYVLVPADNGITPETAVIFRNSRTITVVP